MQSEVVQVRVPRTASGYKVLIGDDLLSTSGTWVQGCLERSAGKLLIVSNKKVFGLYGASVRTSLENAGFEVFVHLIGDGERFKNLRVLESVLLQLSTHGFKRTDGLVALGGGVVGDLTGFAASVYLRGVAFLQIPTTLLSMIDSSVGGKTGVNTSFGKNLVGSFYQPSGVLVDTMTLKTLPVRELTCGFCEAIKQGAIASRSLLAQTASFLDRNPPKAVSAGFGNETFAADLSRLLAAQIGFKARIVQNDEREAVGDNSARSRKTLNFGHTFAHALEKVSNYRGIKHGEAVGYGIRFAVSLSKRLELIGQDEVDLLNDVVRRAGVLPDIRSIDPLKLFEAFRHDKKQFGNSLHWILLSGIGKPVIVPDTDIPRSAIKTTLRSIIQS